MNWNPEDKKFAVVLWLLIGTAVVVGFVIAIIKL